MSDLKKVAYLGPPGTYSQTAALNHFGEEVELLACATIDDAFLAVSIAEAGFAVVPLENSTEGVVNNTQDCLVETDLLITGEEIVSIEHQLMVRADTDAVGINRIASHRQSLAQCRQWLQEHYPGVELMECASNAAAAKLANEYNGTAAIAGVTAADIYGLSILASSIQDQDHNSTRFLVLGKSAPERTGKDKTSILVYTENKPGALFRVLEPFERLQISLTKIDSRPAKKKAWEYVFFIDFEGHAQDEQIVSLFAALEPCTEEVKSLGSYPAFE